MISMETTYHVKAHETFPQLSADYLFGYPVFKHVDL